MKAKRKQKAPSRFKYEQSHPTVSCRVPRELCGRLYSVKQQEGKSFASILKICLGLMEAQIKNEEEIRKRSHTQDYRKGCSEAQRLFRVTCPYSVFGETVELTGANAKEPTTEYMQERRWGHTDYHKKQQGYYWKG